jgi:hypothetical protein
LTGGAGIADFPVTVAASRRYRRGDVIANNAAALICAF